MKRVAQLVSVLATAAALLAPSPAGEEQRGGNGFS
jgi:hypothetical protein